MMIGIAKGEEKRTHKVVYDKGWKACINRIYPLIDLDLDRNNCQRYIRWVKGATIPYPSNCMRCPYMSPIELIWLHKNYPDK